MRTIRIKLYKFSELSKDAKENAINDFRNNPGYDCYAWEDTLEDAKQIELIIDSLDDHRSNKGKFENSAEKTAKLILENHRELCDTYKTAQEFLDTIATIESDAKVNFKEENDFDQDEENPLTFDEYFEDNYEEDIENAEKEFLHSLLEDYRIICNKNEEYENSDEYIKETIEANEYEFTKDGKLN